jgi:glycosyltransferase involved in cell wall biosynthesis
MNVYDFVVAHPLKHHAFNLGAGCVRSGYSTLCYFPLYNKGLFKYIGWIKSPLIEKFSGYYCDGLDEGLVVSNLRFLADRIFASSVDSYVERYDNHVSGLIKRGVIKGRVFVSLQDYMPKSVAAAKNKGFLIWSDQILNNSKTVRESIAKAIRVVDPKYVDGFSQKSNDEVLKISDFITSPSRYCDEGFLNIAKLDAQVFRVNYGVDDTIFEQKVDFFGDGEIRVLVRAHNIRKGGVQFLKALYQFKLKSGTYTDKKIVFTIVGEPDSYVKHELLKFQSTPNFEVSYIVVPNRNMPELMRRSDIFIMPSMSEGMSLMCVEAMKVGLPLIITKQCGINNFDDTMGVEIECTHESISLALDKAFTALDIWPTWGQKAHEASKKFNWKNYQNDVVNVCEKIMRSI